MSHNTTHRWAFLLEVPREIRRAIDPIAQDTLDRFGNHAFKAFIYYPITDPQGNRYGTLSTFRNSDYWSYLNSKVVYEHGGKCDACESELRPRTYHRSFRHIGREESHLDELIVLCDSCHDYFRQQLWTGRRYGWRAQPLEDWLYTSKQRQMHYQSTRTAMDGLHTETAKPLPIVDDAGFVQTPQRPSAEECARALATPKISPAYAIPESEPAATMAPPRKTTEKSVKHCPITEEHFETVLLESDGDFDLIDIPRAAEAG